MIIWMGGGKRFRNWAAGTQAKHATERSGVACFAGVEAAQFRPAGGGAALAPPLTEGCSQAAGAENGNKTRRRHLGPVNNPAVLKRPS